MYRLRVAASSFQGLHDHESELPKKALDVHVIIRICSSGVLDIYIYIQIIIYRFSGSRWNVEVATVSEDFGFRARVLNWLFRWHQRGGGAYLGVANRFGGFGVLGFRARVLIIKGGLCIIL